MRIRAYGRAVGLLVLAVVFVARPVMPAPQGPVDAAPFALSAKRATVLPAAAKSRFEKGIGYRRAGRFDEAIVELTALVAGRETAGSNRARAFLLGQIADIHRMNLR